MAIWGPSRPRRATRKMSFVDAASHESSGALGHMFDFFPDKKVQSQGLGTRRVHKKHILRRLTCSRRFKIGRSRSEWTLQNTEIPPKFSLIRLLIPPTGPLGGPGLYAKRMV